MVGRLAAPRTAAGLIPPAPVRELRELTRYRKTLVQARTDEVNRLQKTVEAATLNIAAVATSVLGVSGRAMLAALLEGEQDPLVLAVLARGKLGGNCRHSARHWSEVRQLFARDRRLGQDAPLVFIEIGAARQLRAACHAGDLVCPFPGCPDSRLITRGGTRRDHFAHRRALDTIVHAPERWYHLCSKYLIGDWVRRLFTEARVQIVHEAVDNGQVPDVLVVCPDGRRLAFEVQYAPLTIAAWRARHDGYRAQGIVDIWLFGHIPPHFRAARARPGEAPRFVFTELLEAVELAGSIARWIDPDVRAVRTPLHALGWQRVRSPSGAWLLVETRADPLDACLLEGGGV